MELNIETAVRLCPLQCNNGDIVCVQTNNYNNTVQLGNMHTYHVNYALPLKCPQNALFTSAVSPLLTYLFEGCDVSIVTIGQSGMGKTYTILGPELNCTMSESEQGIIPRFLRELFMKLPHYNDRHNSVHITWSQICGENVQDLLGAGSIECTNISDAFQLIQLGMSNLAPRCAHSLFTVTLEQEWLIDTTIQHRVSTASFADLAGSEKMLIIDNNGITQHIPTDPGLLALQRCIMTLTEPYKSQIDLQNIPYNQSVLTTLLKDSFGGRAKTLLICCLSPFLRDLNETFYTMQLAAQAQMIKNFVTVNSYMTYQSAKENFDIFGLKFAANQLFKLVSNAEELFQRLVANGSLSKNDVDQISQWLTLKQECEECLSETSEPHRSLDIIEEEIENSCESSEGENTCEDEPLLIFEKLEELMKTFRLATDLLVSKKLQFSNGQVKTSKDNSYSCSTEFHNKGARGRRNSIHSADELSSALSTNSSMKVNGSICEHYTSDKYHSEMSLETKRKFLKQICSDIQGYEKDINELEQTISIKEHLLQQYVKHKETKNNAMEKIEQKYEKLKNDHQITKSKIVQAQVQNNHFLGGKYMEEVAEIEEKLKDVISVKGDNLTLIFFYC